jgi:hypothetical protein
MHRGGVVLDDALRTKDITLVVKLPAEEAGYDPADFSGRGLRFGLPDERCQPKIPDEGHGIIEAKPESQSPDSARIRKVQDAR